MTNHDRLGDSSGSTEIDQILDPNYQPESILAAIDARVEWLMFKAPDMHEPIPHDEALEEVMGTSHAAREYQILEEEVEIRRRDRTLRSAGL